MGIFRKDIEDPTKPLEPTVPEGESVPVTPEEKPIEEDRAVFNCGNCQGEGIVWHSGANRYERCSNCGGTGKVS